MTAVIAEVRPGALWPGLLLLGLHPLNAAEGPARLEGRSVDPVERLDALEDAFREGLDDDRVAGASIAVVSDGQVIWSRAYGHADRKAGRRVTADTRFQAGDITKAITAIAVLQQVQAGRYGLDDGIDRLLPDLTFVPAVSGARAPTVRELLTHHGGVPNSQLAGSYGDEPSAGLTPIERVDLVQQPGRVFAYSNVGFALLGQLVQKTAGRPYAEVVRERVLVPLGMSGAGFQPAEEDALGHDKRRRPHPNLHPRDLSSQGLLASANDVARLIAWTMKADTTPVLERRWVDEMARAQNTDVALDMDNRQGLAWHLTNTGRHRVDKVLRLSSSTIHFRGILLIAPAERIGVVVMANGSPGFDFTVTASRRILDQLLDTKHGIPPPVGGHGMPEHIPLPEGSQAEALGPRYSTGLGLIRFSGGPERYDMDFLGRGFSARRREDGWYEIAYRLLGLFDIRFNLLEDVLIRPALVDGEHVLLSWYQGSRFLFGSALGEPAGSPPTELVGRYRLLNPDALSRSLELEEIRVIEDDGWLLASYRLPVFVTLRPQLPLLRVDQRRYRIPGLGTNLGDVVRTDAETGEIHYSGYHFRKLD